MKKIYKYPTGAEVPEGAKYLNTVAQTKEHYDFKEINSSGWKSCFYVWHYYEVEVDDD